jgi:hypothetical protein
MPQAYVENLPLQKKLGRGGERGKKQTNNYTEFIVFFRKERLALLERENQRLRERNSAETEHKYVLGREERERRKN